MRRNWEGRWGKGKETGWKRSKGEGKVKEDEAMRKKKEGR